MCFRLTIPTPDRVQEQQPFVASPPLLVPKLWGGMPLSAKLYFLNTPSMRSRYRVHDDRAAIGIL